MQPPTAPGAPNAPGAADTALNAFANAMGQWVGADGPAAVATLSALDPEALDASRRAARRCILERFAPAHPEAANAPGFDDPSLPPPLSLALRAYRTYWTLRLMRIADVAHAEAQLARELAAAGTGAAADEPLEQQVSAARALAERLGWHALGGVTAPLHEFMLWRRQTSAVETVTLPEGGVEVTVTRLEGFASLGWLGHATCDRHHTGGWATATGVMVVAASWDFASEAYRVSLLAHEAQHIADQRRFPRLGAADLEFRAKLVELMLATTTRRDLVRAFVAQARPERGIAHAFASHWLVTRLRDRLGTADLPAASGDALRAAAAAELQAHTEVLLQRGAADVQTALPD